MLQEAQIKVIIALEVFKDTKNLQWISLDQETISPHAWHVWYYKEITAGIPETVGNYYPLRPYMILKSLIYSYFNILKCQSHSQFTCVPKD